MMIAENRKKLVRLEAGVVSDAGRSGFFCFRFFLVNSLIYDFL